MLSSLLTQDLIYRTEFIFDIDSTKFNSVYAFSTFFDPSTKKYLHICDSKLNNDFPMEQLLKFINRFVDAISDTIDEEESIISEPAKKKNYSELDSLLDVNCTKKFSEVKR